MQRETFAAEVKPRLQKDKTAYVLVDALRYEMARELVDLLATDGDVSIAPALGSVPSVTEIGMAALVAMGDEALGIQNSGKLLLTFDGQAVKDRKSRVEHLRERAGVPVAETKLESVVPRPKKRLADEMREAPASSRSPAASAAR